MMLNSSIRRVVRSSALSLPSVAPAVGVGASATGFLSTASRRAHPRRYSSSKPPVPPNDGSRPMDASSQTPAKGVNPAGQKREGKASKRKGKDNGRNGAAKLNQPSASLNLPSVPSTQHLQPQDMHVASFFSLHRPMSVTTAIPPTTKPETFNALFDPKAQGKMGRDNVMFTISSTVNTMENAIHGQQQYTGSEQDDLRHAVTQASVSNAEADVIHLDSLAEQDLQTSVEEFAKRLRPFQPPPAPEPFSEDAIVEEEAHSKRVPDNQQTTFSTVLTIRESTHPDGHKTYEAHVSPLVREEDMEAPSALDVESTTSIEDPSQEGSRKTYIERIRDNRTMHAISVRRQRKLKMKKHKFKKLLRRTRTLRRKLDKA